MILYFFIRITNIKYKFVLYYRRVIKMKPLKSKLSMTIDEDVLERLRVLAEEDDRSLSQYINRVLREHLKTTEISGPSGRM